MHTSHTFMILVQYCFTHDTSQSLSLATGAAGGGSALAFSDGGDCWGSACEAGTISLCCGATVGSRRGIRPIEGTSFVSNLFTCSRSVSGTEAGSNGASGLGCHALE